jgi:hypothetical protein
MYVTQQPAQRQAAQLSKKNRVGSQLQSWELSRVDWLSWLVGRCMQRIAALQIGKQQAAAIVVAVRSLRAAATWQQLAGNAGVPKHAIYGNCYKLVGLVIRLGGCFNA